MLDLLEQLVDRLVAARGNADPAAAVQQVQDEMGSGVRLARARRALDEQVAAVESFGDPCCRLEIELAGLQRLALAAGGRTGKLSAQDLAQRLVGAIRL